MIPARLTGLVVVADDTASLRALLMDVLGGEELPNRAGSGTSVSFEPGVAIEIVPRATVDSGDASWADGNEGLHRLRFEVPDLEQTAQGLIDLGYRLAARGDASVVLHAPQGMGGALELAEPSSELSRPSATHRSGLIRRVDHVCAPSADLRRSFEAFSRVLGGVPVFGGDAPHLGVLSVQVRFDGGMKVELLQPRRPRTAVGQFAERHPGRFHHLTMLTPDIPDAVDQLAEMGWDAIDTDVVSDPDWHETYLRPSLTGRALLQIAATAVSFSEPLDDETMERIFEGGIDAERYVMVPK
ncbi:MAG: VOC family protein [Microthrixaceae bacterium]